MVPSDRIDPVILGHILGHHRELHSRLLTLKAAYVEPVADGPQRMDGAALAWMEVTMKCVQCHKYVRDVRDEP